MAGSRGWLFFYPVGFTFVRPSEILAHDHRLAASEDRGVKVVGVSVVSHFTHLAWKNKARSVPPVGTRAATA